MKFLDILAQANSNLWRNKLRSALTILAIFIGSFTIILNTAINAGVNSFIDAQVESIGGEGHLEITSLAMIESMMGMMGSSGPQKYDPEKNASAAAMLNKADITKIESVPGIIKGSVKPFVITPREVMGSPLVEYVTGVKTEDKYRISPNALPSNSLNIDLTAGRRHQKPRA